MANIRIGYSYNQEEPIEEHLRSAGLVPVWVSGKPNERHPDGKKLRKGIVEGHEDIELVKTRSSRIPKRVSEGVYDLGFVGTDVFQDHYLTNINIVSKYDHGRVTGKGSSYLELVACKESEIITISDLVPGTIVHTEVPHLTKKFLEEHGIKTALYWNTQEKEAFKQRLIRSGRVGLELSPGGVAQDLQSDEALALVTEFGDTREDYDLRTIAKICDIDTLLIANAASLLDPEKSQKLKWTIAQLDEAYVSKESEGRFLMPEGRPLPGTGVLTSPQSFGSKER